MFLICPPNSVIIPIYTVSHPKKEPPKIHLTLVKVNNSGVESLCTAEDDYSVCNLPGNSIFKQMEFMVGNSNVIDQSISAYPYKAIIETILSMFI